MGEQRTVSAGEVCARAVADEDGTGRGGNALQRHVSRERWLGLPLVTQAHSDNNVTTTCTNDVATTVKKSFLHQLVQGHRASVRCCRVRLVLVTGTEIDCKRANEAEALLSH
eukprot:507177-Hanusia_phi.AAC.5